MNLRLLAALLTLVSLSSGCIYVDGGPSHGPGAPGDVGFTWTLAGTNCGQVPNVRNVRITIPGERLENGGVYGCSNLGVMGIVLHDFHGGTYSFTADALDGAGQVVYSESGQFHVNGDVSVDVELAPLTSAVDLSWGFPANSESSNPSCALAGVPYMAVHIDGKPQQAYLGGQPVRIQVNTGSRLEWRDVVPCEWGQRQSGFRVALPGPGVHHIDLYAVDEKGFMYYAYSGEVRGLAGQVAFSDYAMQWAVGGVNVQWKLYKDTSEVSCGTAGVSRMFVSFVDAVTHKEVYEPSYGVKWECGRTDAFFFLPQGDYYVYVRDADAGRYSSSDAQPPLIHVQNGGFPTQPLKVNVYAKAG